MPIQVLIAHARSEESCAEELATPLREAGFEVAHQGTVLVGDSVVAEASRVLMAGGPVVLCGTIRALGTKWARQLVNAARANHGSRIFCVQMDEEADVEAVSFDEKVAEYWRDPALAVADLIAALRVAYPADEEEAQQVGESAAEARYRRLALESCDIVDLANLPESERHIATRKLELRRLYVPLNVIVKAGDEPDALQDALALLEEQRLATRGWFSAQKASPDDHVEQRVPLGERLRVSRRLVVLGDPGAGKTTMLRWLATAYLLRLKRDVDLGQLPAVETLPEEDWLPVIVRCRDLTPECASGALDDVLGHTLRKAELSVEEAAALRRLLRSKLEQGHALLLIDGLDEIADPALRARFARQLEQIHVAFPDAPIVVTSRIVGYRDMGYRIGRGFEHVTVAEFEPEEKNDFAARWCALTELPERREAATQDLIADIHSTDRIERLTGNPMLLTTMALVKRKVGRLPTRRADLYWEALYVLLNWRPEVDQPIDPREAVPQLEYVAYAMCDRAIQRIQEDSLLELLERLRDDYPRLHDVRRRSSAEFLQALESRTGILIHSGFVRDRGRPVRVYEFRHLTFQEYLAGRALVDGVYPDREPAEELARAIGRIAGQMDEVNTGTRGGEVVTAENWREAVRLAVANARYDEADDVLLAVLSPAEAEAANRRARAVLAAFCLADEPKVGEEVAREVLSSLAEVIDVQDRGFRSTTVLRIAALGVISSRWGDDLRDVLVGEFRRRDSIDRSPVGYVLGSVLSFHLTSTGGPENALVSSKSTPDDNIAISLLLAASASAATRLNPEVSPPLTKLALHLLEGEPPSVQAALTYLSYIQQSNLSKVRDRASRAIRNTWHDRGVREVGMRVVQHLRLNDFYSDIVAELDSDEPALRLSAVTALVSIGTVASDDIDLIAPLSRRLADPIMFVRVFAVSILSSITDSRSVEALASSLSDETLRPSILLALGMSGHKQAADVIRPYLDVEDSGDRRAALAALSVLLLPENDRKLLSHDLDGNSPFLDPREPITDERIIQSRETLNLSGDEVRTQYRALASQFGLTLAFSEPQSEVESD